MRGHQSSRVLADREKVIGLFSQARQHGRMDEHRLRSAVIRLRHGWGEAVAMKWVKRVARDLRRPEHMPWWPISPWAPPQGMVWAGWAGEAWL